MRAPFPPEGGPLHKYTQDQLFRYVALIPCTPLLLKLKLEESPQEYSFSKVILKIYCVAGISDLFVKLDLTFLVKKFICSGIYGGNGDHGLVVGLDDFFFFFPPTFMILLR